MVFATGGATVTDNEKIKMWLYVSVFQNSIILGFLLHIMGV